MTDVNIQLTCEFKESFRNSKVIGMFDLPAKQKITRNIIAHLPIDSFDWQIGLIIGASGSGKTTLAKHLFGDAFHKGFTWSPENSLLDDFDSELGVKEIVNALSHVGLSSPPSWLLSYDKLSNGQQFRAELARLLVDKKSLVVFDEFTSVVDRSVAKIGCAAVSKAIRQTDKQFVAVSCHDDITEWLAPDWIYDMTKSEFKRVFLRRPDIKLDVFKIPRKYWYIFKHYHYLGEDISDAAQCYMALFERKPVAFCSFIHFPHPRAKNIKREHRTVVLPDFQGVGIGVKFSEYVAQLCIDDGYRFISTTSNPALIHARAKSRLWKMTKEPGFVSAPGKKAAIKNVSQSRLTASFEYYG